MKKNLSIVLFIPLLIGFSDCFAQTDNGGYTVVNKISLPGDGGWDYLAVEEPAGRLYVSHGTMVQVMDVNTGELIGTIDNTPGVHGIAIASEFNKGFISNGKDNSVTIFDLSDLSYQTTVKVTGINPDAILFDPFSKKVFVYNGRSSNATVIDASTNDVIATIKLEGKPEFSVSDNKGNIYVNIEDKSLLTKINAATLHVEANWPLNPGEEPSGLAIDNKTHRLFSGCSNQLMIVVDAETGKIITTLPIGRGCDGVSFDPGLNRAFASCGDGTLTVVQEDGGDMFKVIENVTTQSGARTNTLDLVSHNLFLSTAEFLPAPEPTADNPHPRKGIKPGTFVILKVAPGE